jgi:hypothetical protein
VQLGGNIYYIFKLTALGSPMKMSELGAAQVGLTHDEFVRRVDHGFLVPMNLLWHGAEAVELIMWLTMCGALNPTVRRVHRFYQMPVSLTAAGLVAFEN